MVRKHIEFLKESYRARGSKIDEIYKELISENQEND